MNPDGHSATFAAGAVRDLRKLLAEAGDEERARGMQAYMKAEMPFHGVPADETRAVAARAFAGIRFASPRDWSSTIQELWDRCRFREEWYSIISLARSRASAPFQLPSALPTYGRLITSGAWWDTVDELAVRCVGPILRSHPAPTKKVLRAWSRGSDLWRRRSSIIAQVGSKEHTDPDLLAACMEPSLPSHEFFLRKAIGWALRQYAYVDPSWVRRYVRDHGAVLSGLSRREALRHLA